jgi:hypothetical protein
MNHEKNGRKTKGWRMPPEKLPTDQFLQKVDPNEDHILAEVRTRVRVTREQAEAFKALPKELQANLGPPVYGQVMSARELTKLASRVRIGETSSTIMCPW